MNITDLTKPMPDEKSRAYRVPVDPAWFQERDCVVIESRNNCQRIVAGLNDVEMGTFATWGSPEMNDRLSKIDGIISGGEK